MYNYTVASRRNSVDGENENARNSPPFDTASACSPQPVPSTVSRETDHCLITNNFLMRTAVVKYGGTR
jgi:hypothetical protein